MPSNRKEAALGVLRRFAASTSGNFVVMTALFAPAAVVLAAIAVDTGSIYTERRNIQSITDLAAITAAANLSKAETAAVTALKDNGISQVTVRQSNDTSPYPPGRIDQAALVVVPGHYSSLGTLAVADRFVAGAKPFNAVQVKVQTTGTRYFGSSLIGPPMISTQAVAGVTSEAAFSVGSRLLRVDGGILNAVLGSLLGGHISLTAMDYNALLAADVEMFDFLDALALELHLTAGTYTQVLDSEVTIGQLAKAMASIPGLDNRSQLALKAVARDASAQTKIPLSHVLDLGSAGKLAIGDHPAGLKAVANVMELLTASAAIANGDHQVELDLGANIPGLAAVTLDLAIGEPPQSSPWFSIGQTGDIVRTAQTRVLITVQLLGSGGLLGASIKLPIYAEVAYAEAKLTDITCPSGRPDSLSVSVAARPGIAELRIADIDTTSLDNFTRTPTATPTKIVQLPLASITGKALVSISNLDYTPLKFTKREIDDHAVKTVSTRDFTQSLSKSLIGNLDLSVKIIGLDLGLSQTLKTALGGTLNAVTPTLDDLLYGVLTALGVRLGEADVRVHGAACGRSVLVQ